MLHHVGRQGIEGIDGQPAFMFVGHHHEGALDDDYLEVGVAMWRDGTVHEARLMDYASCDHGLPMPPNCRKAHADEWIPNDALWVDNITIWNRIAGVMLEP